MLTIKRAGYAAAGIAAGVLVLLGLPALIEWDGYKGEVVEAVQARTGRQLSIDGPLNVYLLPLPHVSAANIHVGPAPGGSDSIGAAELELRPALLPLVSGRFELASLRLVDASLDAGGMRLDGLTAQISPLSDGYSFAARMPVRGVPLTLSGQLDGQGALSARLGVGREVAEVALKGRLTGGTGFTGQIEGKAASVRELAAVFGWTATRLPQGGAGLKGDLVVDGRYLRLGKGVAMLAGAEGTASLEADFASGPQIDAALAFDHIDLDQWVASLPAPTLRQSPAAPSATPEAPAKDGPAVASPAPAGFPKALSLSLDLSAGRLTLKGGELKQARLNASLSNGELLVNQAGVELPGDGELNLFGFFTPDPGGLAFDGTLEGRANDLRGMISWLGWTPSGLAEDRLRKGGFSGHLLADSRSLRLQDGVLRLDGAKAELAADLKLGARPALGVSFSVDKLDVDAYRAKGETAPQTPATVPGETKAAGVVPPPVDAARDGWLPGLDANIKGKVGSLTAYGLTAKDLTLDANLLNGALTFRDLSSPDLEGARLSLSGGVAPADRAFRQFRWELRSDHPGRLLKALVARLPVDPERLAPLALTGSLDGRAADKLTLDSRNEIAGGQLELSGGIEHALDRPQLHLTLAASHASLTQLIRLASADYRPQDSLGAFAASTRIEGGLADALTFQDLRLKLGPAAAAGEGALAFGGPRPRLDLKLTAGELPVDPFLPTKRTGALQPSLREQIEHGLLIPTKGVPERHWPGDNEQPPPPASAPRPHVAVGGISEHWSAEPLDLSWLSALDAKLDIQAQALTWGKSRLEPASLAMDIQDGAARLDHLKGGLWGGEMLLSGALADNGSARFDGKLSHAQMKQALLSTAGLGMADGSLEGETALTAKGKSVAEMVAHLNGSARIAAKDGLIKGFELKAVDDAARDLKNPLGLINLLQAGLSGGSTKFTSLSGTAKAKDGIVSSDDLALKAEGGGAKGQVTANLPNWVMDAHAAFNLASSPEAPPLVMRLTGALDNPRRFLDINAMQIWLAQKGVGAKGGLKEAGEALGKMLSGEKKDDGSKVKAKDVVKGLLKGIR